MRLFFLLSFLTTLMAHGITAPKLCYTMIDEKEFCTTDRLGDIQVLIYNAGWCGPCNIEMSEISSEYPQFVGKRVSFASLSAEGFDHNTKPDTAFLMSWKKRHSIPFIVAGKYKDFGGMMGNTTGIPFTVIIDAKGDIALKGNLDTSTITAKVNELLKDIEPEKINVKTFFEKIRGDYKVDLVAGKAPYDTSKQASIYTDAEFPNMEMVYVPYCLPTVCMDSGNYFVYDDTVITKTEKGYHLALTQDGKLLHYDWEELGGEKFLYRNLQFKEPSETTMILEHVLTRVSKK